MERFKEFSVATGVCFVALYIMFSFSSCLYGWTVEGVNPGFWQQDTRGAFAGLFILSSVFCAIICGCRERH